MSEELTFSLYEMDIQTGDILSFDIESLSEHVCEGTIQAFLDNVFYTSFEGSADSHHFQHAFEESGNLRIGWLNTDVENNEGCKIFRITRRRTALSKSNETYIFWIEPPSDVFYQYQWLEGDGETQNLLSENGYFYRKKCCPFLKYNVKQQPAWRKAVQTFFSHRLQFPIDPNELLTLMATMAVIRDS